MIIAGKCWAAAGGRTGISTLYKRSKVIALASIDWVFKYIIIAGKAKKKSQNQLPITFV